MAAHILQINERHQLQLAYPNHGWDGELIDPLFKSNSKYMRVKHDASWILKSVKTPNLKGKNISKHIHEYFSRYNMYICTYISIYIYLCILDSNIVYYLHIHLSSSEKDPPACGRPFSSPLAELKFWPFRFPPVPGGFFIHRFFTEKSQQIHLDVELGIETSENRSAKNLDDWEILHKK